MRIDCNDRKGGYQQCVITTLVLKLILFCFSMTPLSCPYFLHLVSLPEMIRSRGLIVFFSAVMISLKHKTSSVKIQYKNEDRKGSDQERGRSVYRATYKIFATNQVSSNFIL